MKLSIYSPEKTIFNGEVQSISVPGMKGSFEVLDNHAAIISTLGEGTIIYKTPEIKELLIKGGFINVTHNHVSVCIEER